jgi:allantoin racemase
VVQNHTAGAARANTTAIPDSAQPAQLRVANVVPAGWDDGKPALPADAPPAGLVETFRCLLPAGLASTPLDLAVKDLIFVDAGLRAEEAGFDAVFVNTVGDYGLPELRSCLGVPVIGAGDSAVRAALALAGPFAVVTVWPEISRPLFERVVERSAGPGQCASIRHVFAETEVAELGGARAVADGIAHSRESVVRAIITECRTAVEEDGAKVIVLGCTCMSAAASRIAGATGVPVVDALRAARAGRLAAGRVQTMDCQSRTRQVRVMVSALAEADCTAPAEPCPICVT